LIIALHFSVISLQLDTLCIELS